MAFYAIIPNYTINSSRIEYTFDLIPHSRKRQSPKRPKQIPDKKWDIVMPSKFWCLAYKVPHIRLVTIAKQDNSKDLWR